MSVTRQRVLTSWVACLPSTWVKHAFRMPGTAVWITKIIWSIYVQCFLLFMSLYVTVVGTVCEWNVNVKWILNLKHHYMYTNAWMYKCIHVCKYAYVWVYIHVCSYACLNIHVYDHLFAYVRIYWHFQKFRWPRIYHHALTFAQTNSVKKNKKKNVYHWQMMQ